MTSTTTIDPTGLQASFPEYMLGILSKHLNKRQANKRALEDYERAYGKYCSPHAIFGTKANKVETIDGPGLVVVEVITTSIDEILNWEGDCLRPKWQVRVARDPDNKMRAMRLTHIRGCCYRLGNAGSLGPYWTMHKDAFRVWNH